jgi:molybdopterin-containing oxidoreductase family membrane subunit
MIETTLKGNKKYWGWLFFLISIATVGIVLYLKQLITGEESTGLSRDVPWGLFIANYTFFVGVAASAVMVVLPHYLHNNKEFAKITVLGEFLAVAAISVSGIFIFMDIGQPYRFLNIMLHITPRSPLFWNTFILPVYLLLNIFIAWLSLEADRNSVSAPRWIKPLIYISIPWAVAIHTTTAFVYCGFPGRAFWNTALLAPRFLVTAFAAGPALLILLCIFIKKISKFDPGTKAIQDLRVIVLYALLGNLFLFMCETFFTLYSGIPAHMLHLKYLFVGLEGHYTLVPWMWASMILMVLAVLTLMTPAARKNQTVLAIACIMTFIGIWIDKGLGMISGGFVPNPLDHITEYLPTASEIVISISIYAIGALIVTVLYKIAISVREETL